MPFWLDTMETRVRTIVAEQDHDRWPHLRNLLLGLSGLYTTAVRARGYGYANRILRSRRLPCKVISVGNLTMGGTGKTPVTVYLARRIQRLGRRVAILSRGYGGTAEKRGGVVSDGDRVLMTAEAAGDEPFLMAVLLGGVPVLVGSDRYRSGTTAVERFGAQVVLLDDGFQHRRLARDLDIVLLDARRPLGNGHLLPRGTLREPVQALARADLVVLTRAECGAPGLHPELSRLLDGRPIYCARHRPVIRAIVPAGATFGARTPRWGCDRPGGDLTGKRVLAFAGLAHNASFWHSIRALGGEPARTVGFGDHYRYRPEDLQTLAKAAVTHRCDCISTSAKDYVRLPPGLRLPLDLVVVDVDIDFGARADAFDNHIDRVLCDFPSGDQAAPETSG